MPAKQIQQTPGQPHLTATFSQLGGELKPIHAGYVIVGDDTCDVWVSSQKFGRISVGMNLVIERLQQNPR